MITKALRYAYRELISNRAKQIPFWILVGFLPTFLIARFLVYSVPNIFLVVHGVHVHHFTYGVIILAVVGFISLVSPYRFQRWLAVLYGLGLALAFDEFGMWLRLTSNYNITQSEFVMVAILAFLIIVVYLAGIIKRAFEYLRRG